jgi:hypothetical protein
MRVAAAPAHPAWLDPDAGTRLIVDPSTRAGRDEARSCGPLASGAAPGFARSLPYEAGE